MAGWLGLPGFGLFCLCLAGVYAPKEFSQVLLLGTPLLDLPTLQFVQLDSRTLANIPGDMPLHEMLPEVTIRPPPAGAVTVRRIAPSGPWRPGRLQT